MCLPVSLGFYTCCYTVKTLVTTFFIDVEMEYVKYEGMYFLNFTAKNEGA
jgi:hypothetical protein